MKEKSREPFHYRHRTFFVGVFILVPVFLIPLFIIGSLVKSDLFEKWRTLHVRYESAQALQPGNAVNIRGIKVGHVKKVALDENGLVMVTLQIRRRYAPLVRTGCTARLKQKNFVVGDWEIELVGGGPFSPSVQQGDTLAGECPVQLDETLQQITGMVASFDSMLTDLRSGEGLLGQLLSDDSLSVTAGRIKEEVSALFGEIDKAVDNANRMITKLSLFGESGKTAADSFQVLARSADVLLDDAGGAVIRLNELFERLESLPEGADSLIMELRKEVIEADTLLRALEDHWLFRRSIRKIREGN